MAIIEQQGITFNNVYKDGGTIHEDTIKQSTYDSSQVTPSAANFPLVNAVDIDWDEANIDAKVQSLMTNLESITEGTPIQNINTTGDLLYTIANLQAQVTVLTNLVWNAPNDVVLKTFLNGKANIGI